MPENKIPKHVAIILDGNGRWAKEHGFPRTIGHSKGSKQVEVICRECVNLGIEYLTLYAFSTENWNRPQDEVDTLMDLFRKYIKKCEKDAVKNNMRVRIIGRREGLSEDIIDKIDNIEKVTKDFTKLNLTLAINYGSRDEICRAFNRLARQNKQEISVEDIIQNLDTKDLPDPDLLIRTSGEERLSNFLLWQLAYTEIYWTNTYWPDFDKKELLQAVEEYSKRNRRYGKV